MKKIFERLVNETNCWIFVDIWKNSLERFLNDKWWTGTFSSIRNNTWKKKTLILICADVFVLFSIEFDQWKNNSSFSIWSHEKRNAMDEQSSDQDLICRIRLRRMFLFGKSIEMKLKETPEEYPWYDENFLKDIENGDKDLDQFFCLLSLYF